MRMERKFREAKRKKSKNGNLKYRPLSGSLKFYYYKEINRIEFYVEFQI